ncbi:thioredoxin-like 3-2, chloroplastic isoform X2 [Ziziphus jujuba]|uniref:Thioredoxin-like 3-2, chloroplastic isoform X2 n=1 Tax=Ziziphus jujuba TaxID=326968 RepID=A0A6P6G1P0_ZIZJJ|nr:thioredoxin-like 3-2, chloroplastic isoform X2 [Ziziphus jujuba]XP_060676005.1 thioredoxin-like 3-2, chloroplastic isoform X2 [Ziziphus jujuba]
MSVRLNPTVRLLRSIVPRDPSRDSSKASSDLLVLRVRASSSSSSRSLLCSCKFDGTEARIGVLNALGREGSVHGLDDSPVSVELTAISSESQFDRVIAEAQQLEESVIVVWMAGWCRKCIYLKPKLEKLAADYYPRLRFYCVDVNAVPHKLVARAGVTLWKDGKKQAEVIGGHKAYLVLNEVRDMIENGSTL